MNPNVAAGDSILVNFNTPYSLDSTYGPFSSKVGTDCGVIYSFFYEFRSLLSITVIMIPKNTIYFF